MLHSGAERNESGNVEERDDVMQLGYLCFEHFQCLTLEMKARSPDKFMDVSDVKVTDEDGDLSRNMTIRANLDTQFTVSQTTRS